MQSGIATKAKLGKSLEVHQEEGVAKAKGAAMSSCFMLWKAGETAGIYDKQGYLDFIKTVKGVDDPNYNKLVQINSAVNNNKDWIVLQGMIANLL